MTAIKAPAPRAGGESLEAYLTAWAGNDADRAVLADCISVLAQAGAAIAKAILCGPLQGSLGAQIGAANADGDQQRTLDVLADQKIVAALQQADVAYYASEEEEAILTSSRAGLLAVAVDPLDGSSNIDANMSDRHHLLRLSARSPEDATEALLPARGPRAGRRPAISSTGRMSRFVLHLGRGRRASRARPRHDQTFRLIAPTSVKIAPTTREFAINASNYRHWTAPVRAYVDDCIAGETGPRGKDFNMRWVASLVAEAYRILVRGGVYPLSRRRARRLRAGPAAPALRGESDRLAGRAGRRGRRPTASPHPRHRAARPCTQRTPLIFGSADKVDAHRRAIYTTAAVRRRAAAVRQARPVPRLTDGRKIMSIKHPIISVTGSSGAGTTSVKRTFDQIFRREKIKAASIEGDAFHR